MRHDPHAEFLRQRDDAAHLADAADLGDARLHDVERAELERRPKSMRPAFSPAAIMMPAARTCARPA